MNKSLISMVAAAAATISFAAQAENGVTDGEITFGQTAAIGGPASALGTGMRDGINAAFKEVNAAGGVHGRTLKLITLDDGYEPDKAIANINKLIDEDKVFAHIGAVGTPTSKAIASIACDKNVPFVGPFTGAGFLRNMECVANVRASYCQEAETWVKHLTEDLGAKNIAIMYQDDSFGRVGLDCTKKALEKRSMTLAGEGTYQRNTTAVKGGVVKIKKANPDAIVTVGAYKPIAAFIKTARKVGLNVPILNISFTGSKALAKELGDQTDKVVVTQVIPFPFDASTDLVKQYQAALGGDAGFVSLEGYVVGRVAVEALKKAGKDLSRDAFLSAFTGKHDLGGVTLEYNMPADNQGLDNVWLSVVDHAAPNGFKSLNDLSSLK